MMLRAAWRLWGARWGVARLAVAAALTAVLAGDTGARLARLQLASLAPMDYAAEVDALRAEGRYAEAALVGEVGLEDADVQGAAREALRAAAARNAAERDSILRRLADAGRGAVTGQGDSLESLIGAVGTDLFVVGDVRDLAIQGTRLMVDGEADPVILALSGAGIALTAAPQVDWAASILKIARKSGAMSARLADEVVAMARGAAGGAGGGGGGGTRLLTDVAEIARAASPGGAVRLLRHVESAEDVASAAAFLRRSGPGPRGFLALHVTGADGLKLVSKADDATDAAVKAAAGKGAAGAAWLRRGGAARLLRPHFIVGGIKAVYKGNAEALVRRGLEALSPQAWWLLPLVAAWTVLEGVLLAGRMSGRLARGRRGEAAERGDEAAAA